ncbi:MAG: hypothetical protein H8E40_01360 [Chloroflexi bacterium]|nr:hypothetical protein [Chloroflexota bacterium]
MTSINNREKTRPTLKIGGANFTLAAKGYPSTINKKAHDIAERGYKYRIFHDGRQRVLYIGPRRERTRARRKDITLNRRRVKR